MSAQVHYECSYMYFLNCVSSLKTCSGYANNKGNHMMNFGVFSLCLGVTSYQSKLSYNYRYTQLNLGH